ncbi:MAG: response regulator [Opitutaceae bacterium]|nr:response regulator [Opitutaceae bacterium]
MLVVDDEASVRLGCVLALRSDGWDATGESSSRGALERLTTRGEHYDVLVLDYAMPGMNGLELIAALDPRTRPPTLLASAHADGAVACAALKLGVWDFLAKPLVPDELRRRVRRLLTRRDDAKAPDAWLARALGHCQNCAWDEALRELDTWPDAERQQPAQLLSGLIHQMTDRREPAAAAFKRAQWWPEWHTQGADIWQELARRLG